MDVDDVIKRLRDRGHTVELDSISFDQKITLIVDGRLTSFFEIQKLLAVDSSTEKPE